MAHTKTIVASLLLAALLIGGAVVLAGQSNNTSPQAVAANNVSVVDGMQIVTINVRNDYEPRVSIAQAGIPTIVRFNTRGAFGCVSLVRIPGLGINQILPHTGTTDVDIGEQNAGILRGVCAGGSRPFEIQFK
jgi:plastocyanin domain-containing protein